MVYCERRDVKRMQSKVKSMLMGAYLYDGGDDDH